MNILRSTLQVLLPLAVLGGGAGAAYLIVNDAKEPTVAPASSRAPTVKVLTAQPRSVQLDVTSRGTVEPLRTVELAAEVSGRITATHPALRAGGTFTENDVLVEIDPTDFRLSITQQEAAVARAELRLAQEQAEAEAALRAWRKLEGDRPAAPLVLRAPQINEARAAVEAAKAMLQRAQTDLARCRVQLPFAGRVRSVHADIGQTVQRGQRLAVTMDTSELEVRLPVPLRDAGFADLPIGAAVADGPAVELRADFAGALRRWRGRVVRVEAELDRATRQLTAVARVRPSGDAPLLVGMFVEAVISGAEHADVYVVPRDAMVSGDELWLVEERVDDEGRPSQHLVKRQVDVLRSERDRVIIRDGLAQGLRICLSNLQAPVEGMRVRVDQEEGRPR